MTKTLFVELLKQMNISDIDDKIQKLDLYYQLLIEENKKINLTAITNYEDVYLKHFYDSLTLTKIIDLKKIDSLCDIGTGAGFPGIVLKIIYPHLNVMLIDSLNKRIKFLNIVIEKLSLTNINAVHTRAEEYGRKNREQFDIVVARAVAPLNILLEYTIPLVKLKGSFIAMKGNDEQLESSKILELLNCNLDSKKKFKLPIENSNRTLIKFTKLKKTNIMYPRKYSDIHKRPLI